MSEDCGNCNGALLRALGWLLVLLFSVGWLTGCVSPTPADSLPGRVYEATLDAWHDRNDLPPLRDFEPLCGHLDKFDMRAPASVEAFLRKCPPDERGRIGWACLDYDSIEGARNRQYPVAVMHPELPATRWAAHGIHELVHAFALCGLKHQDNGHTDSRLWAGVETAAETALGGP